MSDLHKITATVQALHAAGCIRDSSTGLWLDKAGAPLAAEPQESLRLLRHQTIKRVVAEKRERNELFTR